LFDAHDVDYVLIGATAFPVHGFARATIDVDVFIRPTAKNAEQVRDALLEFGYDVRDITIDDLLTTKLLIRQYALATDIHPFVAGVSYDEVEQGRVAGFIGETRAWFASLEHLIAMKRAAGRPKDLEDLKYLERLKERGG